LNAPTVSIGVIRQNKLIRQNQILATFANIEVVEAVAVIINANQREQVVTTGLELLRIVRYGFYCGMDKF